MDVSYTLHALKKYSEQNPEYNGGIEELRNDIIQSIKFDLGDEFSDMPGFEEIDEGGIPVPNLPFDKIYIEAVSFDKKRYGAIFENFSSQGINHGVCGQMLVEARTLDNNKTCLFPIELAFTQENNLLRIHRSPDSCEEWIKRQQIAALVALNLMVKAIQVMNCSNVKIIDSKAKSFINKKRSKKGKLPIFTYKTLHIDVGYREESKSAKTSSHASPRVHLRRGHIRRMKTGASIWVQPCVVGDKSKGIVHKDYSVSVH